MVSTGHEAVQEFGLKATYDQRQGAHHMIRKLLALPLLPGEQIRRAFQKLKGKAATSSHTTQQLFEYVEDQWLDSSLWDEKERSVYRQNVRTNNDVEFKSVPLMHKYIHVHHNILTKNDC